MLLAPNVGQIEWITSVTRFAKASILASSVSPEMNSQRVLSLRDEEVRDLVIAVCRLGIDSQVSQVPLGERFPIRLHHVARLGNPRDVVFVVGDRDDQRRGRFEQLPTAVGLAFDPDF